MTDEGRVPVSAFDWLSLQGGGLGTTELLLGEVQTARSWFAEGALAETMVSELVWQHREAVGEDECSNLPITAEHALRDALLSADPRVVGAAVDEILELDESYLDDYPDMTTRYYHLIGLAHLLREDTAQARTALASLRDSVEKDDQFLGNYFAEAFADALEGFLDHDEQLVQHALDSLTAYHEDVRGGGDGTKELFDHYTGAYLLLARHRGMNVRIDSEYVPAELYNIEWRSVELPEDTPDALRELYENAEPIA
ncbi:Imm49 family immunity protein [Haloferax profundi]|uniref:Tetratricopeptide repeat protein n=1 Tax=Haloferax profundi TaxID=1544718 RepID=A0A0W1SKK1_9EURY|nr:Imm49 family immunity protein [Haloferax profundi]KTG26688.1 hypothetical protein AUR66_15910 [Haloferax profundi]